MKFVDDEDDDDDDFQQPNQLESYLSTDNAFTMLHND